MSWRETMARRVEPFLQPGESLQAVFWGPSINPVLRGLISLVPPIGLPVNLANPQRIVVATDRRIVVFRSSRLRADPKAVIGELPRNTLIGAAHGRLWYRCTTFDKPLYIGKAFYGEVAAADSAAGLPTVQRSTQGSYLDAE